MGFGKCAAAAVAAGALAAVTGCASFEIEGSWDGVPTDTATPLPSATPTPTGASSIRINEVLFHVDVVGPGAGDANRDGITDQRDQFIELVNTSFTDTVSLENIEIRTLTTQLFKFGAFFLGPGESFLLFGQSGGSGSLSCNARLEVTGQLLSLKKAGDSVSLVLAGDILDVMAWTDAGEANTSSSRSPDLTGAFLPHAQTLDLEQISRKNSAGCRQDYVPF